MKWARYVASAALVVTCGCAPRPLGMPRSNDFVVVSGRAGIAGFNLTAGRLAFETKNAVADADWSKLYAARDNQLDVIDGRTGSALQTVAIPAGFEPVTVSADGTRVALTEPDGAGSTSTRIVVVDPTGKARPRTLDLNGAYAPDAFSIDNQRLFVLEYQPAAGPNLYRVRQLDLKTGVVSGMSGRYKQLVPDEVMRGSRHSHVLSPDRGVLYTLYTNQPEHLHSRDLARGLTESSGETYAFVHVLNVNEGWAFCIDLPQPFGVGPSSAHALALSPDGRWLYVADRSSGAMAVIDAERLVVQDVVNVGPETSSAPATVVVAPDGRLLLGDTAGVLLLSPRTLTVADRIPLGVTPTALGVSQDGRRLFVGTSDRLPLVDLQTRSGLGDISAFGLRRIEQVISL